MASRIEKIVKNLDALPSLPIIAHKLMTVIEDRRTAAKDLAEVISKDPAMTAKVLKLVNSSFFGFSSKISMVSRAVVVLGFNTIKNLALGISVFKTAKSMESGKTGLDMERFWEHSLAVAAGARLIARLTRYKLPEEAFVAGLLHDIGKIIFNQYMPEEFTKAIEMSLKENIHLEKAEMHFIGADHEVAGDYLADRWKLPYAIRKAISQHHNPPLHELGVDAEMLKLICIVSLSNTLCKMKDIGFSGNKYIGKNDEEVLNWFEIEEGLVERFFLEIDNEFARSKEFLGLTTEQESEHARHQEEASQVLVLKKDKKKASMGTIFLKGLGFDCKEAVFQSAEDVTLPEGDLKYVFTDGLDGKEKEAVKAFFDSKELKVKVIEIPVPFNSGAVLKELGIIQHIPEAKKVLFDKKEQGEPVILCIDDEENILKSLKRLLEDHYTVITARSAGEGVALYKEQSEEISVVIVDFRMPVITGMECIQEIKKVNPNAVCIVLSGVKDFGDHLKEKDSSLVYALMDKPWEDEMLLAKIDEAVKFAKEKK